MKSARDFIKSYGLLSKMGGIHDIRWPEDVARALERLPKDGNKRNAYFNIEFRTIEIRKRIEALQGRLLDPAERDVLTNLHGTAALYKCSKPWCEFFTVGFGNVEERKQHVDGHDLPFRCPFEDCFAFRLGYATQSQLDHHKRHHHPELDDGFEFPKVATKEEATLWKASTRGDLPMVEALLDSGVDLNQPSRPGGMETPLYLAAKFGHFDVCELLLKRGASIDFTGRSRASQRTALHAALVAGNRDIVQLLVSQKECLPDEPDGYGRSPFCEACALGHLDIVKILFETGKIQADLRPARHPECYSDGSDESTTTPLGYACGAGHFAVVQYLLQQGQSSLVDEDVINRAARRGHKAIVDLLRTATAKPSRSDGQLPDPGDDWVVNFNQTVPRQLDVDLLHTLKHDNAVVCVGFSHDGKYVATGCKRSARIFDVKTGDNVCVFRDGTEDMSGSNFVRSVCFCPNGKYLAVAGEDKLLRVSFSYHL